MAEKYNKVSMRESIIDAFKMPLQYDITDNLVGVVVGWTDKVISGELIFEGEITDVEEELVFDIEAEVISHFYDYTIDLKARHVGSVIDPHLLAEGIWVYRRET